TTFAAFGFNAGWDRYETISPVKDVPVQEPFVLASRWLEQEFASEEPARRLLVIHTRGGHPPWDVTREEVGKLKPDDYAGPIDPRRGAITLANVRARKQRSQRRLTDDDWTRLRELSLSALVKQNAGLSQLLSTLRRASAWEDTLFVFVGDVAAGDAPDPPYEPAGPLSEDRLLVPLLVKFPGRHFAGVEVPAAVTSVDVARTILEALGLKLPDHASGSNLFAAALGRDAPVGRALVATLGNQYSTRAGSWLLHGEIAKAPRLCQLDVDPACVNDVFEKRPIAARALWQWTFDAGLRNKENGATEPSREPASIDAETAAALTVWGAL
ncbi:MAG TPA: sulfatase-like hydrolase/transferase, partial [Polyangiaceae bacterium]|nr:sulfatase-like hydrolase/transferase [Polyangiaceae bacterium]